MLQDRTCITCGRSFDGGPRAYYCPECRIERTKRAHAAYRARKRSGDVRNIGSTDECERCGKVYTVEAGVQRFCPECQPIHAAEYDRETALPFYHDNKDRINPVRKIKRRKRSNICEVCSSTFEPVNGSTTCSDVCKRLLANKHTREYYEREKARNAPPEEVYSLARIAREIGKHKTTLQRWYHAGKLPDPSGTTSSGREYWYKSAVEGILQRGGID